LKLARNTLLNLIGLGAPLAVALFTIPVLIQQLGTARFGLLTLIWAVVSYFSLFDLGLGRALTQRLASTLARGAEREVGAVVATALVLMGGISLVAAALMATLAPWAVSKVSGIPDTAEAVRAMWIMAATVPAVVMATGLRGILEAQHAFFWVNLIRLPLGIYTFLAPLAVALWWGPQLDAIALSLAAGRLLALAAQAALAWRCLPTDRGPVQWHEAQVRPLLTTGGWLTLGSLVGPIMGYADRFILAAAVSASAVAFYVTPQEIVTKLWIVPGALTAVLFPAFAAAAVNGGGEGWKMAQLGIRWLFVVLVPITLALTLFANPLLSLWVGASFAAESAPVLKWFALGILINCMAHVPLTLLQGAGQARAPAVLQAMQLVPYLALLWWATTHWGVVGAAITWCARMVFDTAAMFALAARSHRPQGPRQFRPGSMLAVAAVSMAFGVGMVMDSISLNAGIGLGLGLWLSVSLAVAWLLKPWAQPSAATVRTVAA